MDANSVYMNYFIKKKDVILQLLEYYKDSNKTVALWGAGKKGEAFLSIIDANNKKIECVFDKDMNKVGKILCNGHRVEDYNKKTVDIVLIANSVFELEVIHILENIMPKTKIINVDNIILGDLEFDNIVNKRSINLEKKRNIKICGVVVLYNPRVDVIQNIASYVDELDMLYVYDNSEKLNKDIYTMLKKYNNVSYIQKNENKGLPVAFNEVEKIAIKSGYNWMITFDQDSMAVKGMVNALREYVQCADYDENVGIVAPVVNEIDGNRGTQDIYLSYFDKVIQSGAMHKLSIMDKIGGYDENMFIDEVDNEYCARCIINGYKIVKINNAILMHNQQDETVGKKFIDGTTVFINKFSSDRYYYRYRNALYCYDKYYKSYPLYALDCQNTIRKMKLQLQYDNDFEEHNIAIKQAISDYKNHHMGKRRKI